MSALSTATLGSGCFWCTEAVFAALRGVKSVTSGYTGGAVENPTYKQVCSGTTGHAEAVQIEFDPATITYEELLDVFFASHDPTTLNRQGADTGTQYRSVIFATSPEQRKTAEKVKQRVDKSGAWDKPIVTEITDAKPFTVAEDHHQDYLQKNPGGYSCHFLRNFPKIPKE